MIELTAAEQNVLDIVIAERNTPPLETTILTDTQEKITWVLRNHGLIKNIDCPGDPSSWLWRPTQKGLRHGKKNNG